MRCVITSEPLHASIANVATRLLVEHPELVLLTVAPAATYIYELQARPQQVGELSAELLLALIRISTDR
ncbi:hypothetical protein [Demequina rhizosphaerae]|uniref:hypothetical protein n=1 Tax=Demequina rhizosphaerae TaxID=1638985 RepID=UPI0012E07576|nr:hypothetical protein [Demequina rhizosphaerae]